MNVRAMVQGRLTCRKGLQPTAFYLGSTIDVIALYTYQANGKDYVGWDGGRLYKLRACDGSLIGKIFGAPWDHTVVGNDRLISIYPARGAPVVYDNTV